MYHDIYNIIHKEYDYALDLEILDSFCLDENLSQTHVLEVGCGTGEHTALLSSRFQKVTAIDLDPEMIKRAKRRLHTHENVSLFLKPASALSEMNISSYDLGCSFFNVINYLTLFEELTIFFSSIASSLKARGGFLCDTLDSSIEFTKESSNFFTYQIDDKVLDRTVKSVYDAENHILAVQEIYSGTYLKTPIEFKKNYKLWTPSEISKAVSKSGLHVLAYDKKNYYKPAFSKKNQIVYFLKKD